MDVLIVAQYFGKIEHLDKGNNRFAYLFYAISHPKSRISHPHITNLLQRYDIIKEWICISKNQRKVGGHYEDSGL